MLVVVINSGAAAAALSIQDTAWSIAGFQMNIFFYMTRLLN